MNQNHDKDAPENCLSDRERFDIIQNTGEVKKRTDDKIGKDNDAENLIQVTMASILYAVRIEQKRKRAEHDHDKAQGCKRRGIGNEDLSDLGFSEHPYRSHEHAPAKILHVKGRVINDSQRDTEQNGGDCSKQNKEGNVRRYAIFIVDGFPDRGRIAAVDWIDQAGIVGGVGRKLNAKLLPGVLIRGRAKDIPAGGILSRKPRVLRAVLLPKLTINIKGYVLQ